MGPLKLPQTVQTFDDGRNRLSTDLIGP